MRISKVKNKNFIDCMESMRKELEKAPFIMAMSGNEPQVIELPKVEVTQMRYEQLIACETELKLLKRALANFRLSDSVIKIFGIERED